MITRELQRIQHAVGYLPTSELVALAERIEVPLHRLHEVASFFPHFHSQPPPEVEVHVCRDMSCHLRGSAELRSSLEALRETHGEAKLGVSGVSCLGRCDRAPAVSVTRHDEPQGIQTRCYHQRQPEELRSIVEQVCAGEFPPHDPDVGLSKDADQWYVDVYRRQSLPEYSAVRRFVEAVTREPNSEGPVDGVLKALETAGLLGMGGAGGRAYKKWRDVHQAEGERKYVVCNADESEPGTFKDREILLQTPHLLLEGMIQAGLLLGAQKGYVYVRHEYEEQIEIIEKAIREAEELGVCGQDILGSGRSFSLEVFVSPGGYICGEQTALIEAMEDKRAEPRNRPPELQTNGLWDKPTLLNNVETFAWVPAILLGGEGQEFADRGKPNYKGKRLFSISGDVTRPGVYEVPNGIPLRELLELAGGVRDGRELKAFAASGPSGGFLPRRLPVDALPPRFVEGELEEGATHFDLLDWELDIGRARKMNLMLGGGMVVYADDVNMVEQALCCLEFYRNESCGKCVPCRLGSQKLVDIGTSLKNRELHVGDLYGPEETRHKRRAINELSVTMTDTAICGLGTVAANPMKTLLRFFRDDVEEYLRPDGETNA